MNYTERAMGQIEVLLGMLVAYIIFVLIILTMCCTFSTLPPPVDPDITECVSEQHAWKFHLPHDALSPVVVNHSSYTPDLASWNALGTPIDLRDSGQGFRITIEEGGDASSGWLGLASVRARADGHIVSAEVAMNRVLLDRYPDAVAAHVLAQEIGHLLGLDHQRFASPPSAMDDCVGRGSSAKWLACLSDPAGRFPNPHDAEQLRKIYAHVDDRTPPPTLCGNTGFTMVIHEFAVPAGGGL